MIRPRSHRRGSGPAHRSRERRRRRSSSSAGSGCEGLGVGPKARHLPGGAPRCCPQQVHHCAAPGAPAAALQSPPATDRPPGDSARDLHKVLQSRGADGSYDHTCRIASCNCANSTVPGQDCWQATWAGLVTVADTVQQRHLLLCLSTLRRGGGVFRRGSLEDLSRAPSVSTMAAAAPLRLRE